MSSVRTAAVAFALLLALVGPASAQQTTTLRLGTWGSPQHPQVTSWVPLFSSEVEKNSKGRLRVQHFPAAGLVKEADVASAVPAGVADISLGVLENFSSVDPILGVFGSPLLQLSFDQWARAMHPGTPLFEATKSELRSHGMVLLSAIDIGPPVFISRDPLRTPVDFKGKTIRSLSQQTAFVIQALGAAPTQLNQNDVYAALSTGTVSAAYGGLAGIYGAKQYEVGKYLEAPGPMFGSLINCYVMNASRFDALPPDLQRVVSDAAAKAEVAADRANADAYDKILAAIAQHGDTVIHLNPSAFRAESDAVLKAAHERYPASAPIVKAILAGHNQRS